MLTNSYELCSIGQAKKLREEKEIEIKKLYNRIFTL